MKKQLIGIAAAGAMLLALSGCASSGDATAEAYARLGRTTATVVVGNVDGVVDALACGDETALSKAIQNDFEELIAGEPWFAEACQRLVNAGASRVFLCGSGSTVAGLFQANISLEKCQSLGIVSVATLHL